jgi:hypothetical protein
MHVMRSVMSLLFVLAACGKTSSPTPEGSGTGTVTTGGDHSGGSGQGSTTAGSAASSDPFDRSLVALDSLKTRMCACADTACTTKVMDDFKTWFGEMKRLTAGKKPNKQQDERGTALDKELRACRTTIAAKAATGSALQPTGSASGDPFDLALVDLEAFKTRMCGCTDKTCADKVQADVQTWQRALRAKLGATAKPTSMQDMRGKAIEKEMKDCRAKAEYATAGAPGTEKVDVVVKKMQGFRDRACACKDKACGTAVTKELADFAASLAKELADVKPTKEQDAQFDKLDVELKACVAKL